MHHYFRLHLFLLIGISSALNLVRRDSPSVIHAPIERRSLDANHFSTQLFTRRQAATVELTLTNEVLLYFANISIGTPPQEFSLHLDTGSSDLWVNTDSSDLCSTHLQACQLSGTYSANDSSTYRYLNGNFNITYLDGSSALGDYVSDTVRIANATLRNQQFSIGYNSSKYQGVLGLGYGSNEGFRTGSDAIIYPNVPQALKDKGYINSVAFSLWLNDLEANTGSILFGGVDKSKFSGDLQTLPVIPYNGIYSQLVVGMTGLGIDGNENSIAGDQSIPVLLDSGTTITYLPRNLTDQLYDEFNIQTIPQAPSGIIDCSATNSTRTIDFSFSSVRISVPLSEMVILGGYDRTGPVCLFGVTAAGPDASVLGDTFLRSAYVVYDLSNNKISLAQTNLNGDGTSDIVEIQDDVEGIPMATPVPNPVTTAASMPTGEIVVINGGSVPGQPTAAMEGGAASLATLASLGFAGVIALVVVCILAIT